MKVAVLLVVLTSMAFAKPLPDGMKIAVKKGAIVATKGGVTVTVLDGNRPYSKVLGAELTDDGKLAIKYVQCDEESEDPTAIPFGIVEAKFANLAGMAAHKKKKYDDAIAQFTIAAQKDPSVPMYATNLLSAQAMAKKLDDADKTIATYGKSQVPWFAWRLAVDPELKALKGRPSAKLGTEKPGKAKGDLHDKIAYSPLGYVATEINTNLYDGMPSDEQSSDVVFIEIATGKELLRLASRKDINTVLAVLGFDVLPKAYVGRADGTSVTAADGRKLEIGNAAATLVVGKSKTELPWDDEIIGAAFVPKGVVGVMRGRTSASCFEGMTELIVVAAPTP